MKEQNAAHLTEGVSIHDAKKCSFSLKIPSPTLHQRNKNFCLCWHTETRLFRESTILLLKSTEIDNEQSSVESFSLENVDLIDISPVFPCTLAKFLKSHNAESDRTFSRKSCSLFMLLVPSRI